MSRINYHEGTCFAVPLRNGGFARGIVTRSGGQGLVFGYFFGPLLSHVDSDTFVELQPSDSILAGQFGDLGLLRGEWPIFGRQQKWSREHWPMPLFWSNSDNPDLVVLTEYDDRSLETKSVMELSRNEMPASALRDRVMGYGSVEIQLTRLCASSDDSGRK